MEAQFKHIALGTRISLLGDTKKTFVKLSDTTLVEFINEAVVCFNKSIVHTVHPNWVFLIRENFNHGTYHEFPKTAFQEGQEFYWKNPHDWKNPYEEGTQEHVDWGNGYGDSYDGDCE